MNKPSLGEANSGSVIGAIVGAIGGLFAVGIAPAIVEKKFALLFGTPILALASWMICGLIGWLMGGQLGPRLGDLFRHRRAEAVGGALGGLVPVVIITLWGWYMVTPH